MILYVLCDILLFKYFITFDSVHYWVLYLLTVNNKYKCTYKWGGGYRRQLWEVGVCIVEMACGVVIVVAVE